MREDHVRKFWLVLILCFVPVFVFADEGEAPKWYDSITVNGFLSASYTYNFNDPDSGLNGFRVFDFDHNSFKLDVAELVLQKPVSKGGDIGFRLDAVAGGSIPKIIASNGLFRNADGTGEDFDLEQAYISYMADVGNGLKLDIGKHITHTGMEVIEGYDGYNDNYSRSFLFGYAIPFTHTGIKATYAFNDHVTGMFLLANGWDNVKDNNDGKSFGTQFTVTAAPVTLYLNYMVGPEKNESSDLRNLFDVVAVFKINDTMTAGINFDYGTDADSAPDGDSATWDGFAGYFRADLNDAWSLALRAEIFQDNDGFRTGVTQDLTEFTITPSYKVNGNFVFRSDLRFDHSNEQVFDDNGDPSDNQVTIGLNAIFLF